MEDFLQKEEYEELNAKRIGLEAKIKLRIDLEKAYEKHKIQELDRELDQLKKNNLIARQRNEGILKTLQSNLFSNFQKAKITSHSQSLLTREKNKYSDYLAYQVPNLKNEFKVQMKSKQNELFTVKTLLETQIQRNIELCEIEQDFFNNMNKANNNLNEQIKNLTEMNNQIEKDRKILLIKQAQTDNINKEHFFNMIESNIKKENDLNNLLQSQLKQQLVDKTYVNQVLEEERNKIKKENEEMMKKLVESKVNFIEPSNPKKEKIKEEEIKSINENNLNSIKKEEKKIEETKKINEKNLNIIDKIRLERKMKNSKENIKGNDKPNEKDEKEEDKIQKNDIVIKQKEPLRNDPSRDEEFPNIEKNEEKQQVENKQSVIKHIQQIEEVDINNKGQEKEQINIKVKGDKSEEDLGPEFSKKKSVSEVSSQKKPELKKKNTFSQMIEDKPVLEKVPTIYKTKTVKRIIAYLEQFSKSKKPGNFIYSTKIINQVSQKIVKDSFYEIISNEQYDFSTSDPELLISTIGEILYLSGKPNLNIDNNDLDEIEFDMYIDKDVKELYNMTLDHLKKMVKEQKTSLPIASNFLTQKLNNFSKSSDIKHKLLPIMEKKLSTGKTLTMSSGFNKSVGFGGFGLQQNNFRTTVIGATKKPLQTKAIVKDEKEGNNVFDNYD